jgi:tetratricopeptide (TPR) repeat protein
VGERRLNSWKEIAAFLGRTERTAKRWEANQGLPIRRVPSSGRGSVFAYEHELRSWLNSTAPMDISAAEISEKPAARPFVPIAVALTVAALLVAVVVFSQRQQRVSPEQGTSDKVAADLYQSGEHEWQTRTPTGLGRAIRSFDAAIARDPHFARAYLGLADAYILAREFGMTPSKEAYEKARNAVTQALKLDSTLSGAHAALGFLDFYSAHNVTAAKQEFVAAISLDPRDPIARHWYATMLMTIGEFRAASDEIAIAETLDSESTAIVADKALIFFYEGRKQDAGRILQQIESDQPAFASVHAYMAYMDLVDSDDSGYLRELKQFAGDRRDIKTEALADRGIDGLAQHGHTGMLQALLQARLSRFARADGSAYEIAELYALLGDSAHALQFLRESVTRSEPEAIALKIDLCFGMLRKRLEYQRLIKEAGLAG